MEVVKLGGSLLATPYLPTALEAIERRSRERRIVLVVGGGAFADQVREAQRQWHFDDRTAHRMAILAMQQTALLIRSLRPAWDIAHGVKSAAAGLQTAGVVIWSPRIDELDEAGIPASWEVTSDSLAAWLASTLKASLLTLVKAAELPDRASLEQLQESGIIDAAFLHYSGRNAYTINVVNPDSL